jgi:hypothetical protein
MVYIRCLINVIGSNFVKVLLIILFATVSTIFLINREKGMELLGFSSANDLPKISFVTTLNGSSQDLKNKIIILPGVKLVEHKNSETIKEKISLIFKSDVLQDVISSGPGYSKYTIFFKHDVTSKSINLIKSYVIKILSGEEVYFGKLNGLSAKRRFSRDNIFYFIYGVSLLILLGFYTVFEINLRKLTYIFQRFQRVRGLSFKVSFLSFFSLVIFPTMLTLYSLGGIGVNNVITFLIPCMTFFFIINLKRYRWLN